MLEQLKNKKDLVFVGGFACYMQGLKASYHDYDVVVLSLTGGLEDARYYLTDSAFSKTGKRAVLETPLPVDIFIEDDLPEYVEIDGFKCQTVESMIQYYEGILPLVRSVWIKNINDKLNLLKQWQEKI